MSNKEQQNLVPRPPVVVVMGHIDHGKSTLLDYIRKTEIVASEAGGITQHMGAYQVLHVSPDDKKHEITFLDTPGHAAFSGIRKRGAKSADIAILVVSAEDGVKPQTLEALKAIQAQKIPYIVAINKIDKPNADIDRTKTSLGENEIYVEGWGGDIPVVAISALNGLGVPELLDMILLVSELASLKTDPSLPAIGIVIETKLDTRTGISATVLVRDGTLKVGSFIVAENSFAPIRYIDDFQGKKIKSANASMPVSITGWNTVPNVGASFEICETKKEAEKLVRDFEDRKRSAKAESKTNITSKDIASTSTDQKNEDDVGPIIIPIVIKADATGSLEAVRSELQKITHDKVKLKIISEGIGNINENDVKLALGDPSVMLIGFNASPDNKASAMIERASFPILIGSFTIIYKLTEYIQEVLMSKVPKEFVEEVTGRAKIMAVFSKEKDKQIVGGKVETGFIASGNEIRIMRREAEIGRGKIRGLQEKKQKTSEVAEGHECGMMLEAKVEIAPGDKIESVRTVEKEGVLDPKYDLRQ